MEAKGAGKKVAKFELLVVQTERAASIANYLKIATPILDEVDNPEKVFEKQSDILPPLIESAAAHCHWKIGVTSGIAPKYHPSPKGMIIALYRMSFTF